VNPVQPEPIPTGIGPLVLGEAPMWHAAEARLYLVDLRSGVLLIHDPETGATRRHSFGEPLGSFVFRRSGGMLLALASGLHFFDPATERRTFVANPESGLFGNRFNDGKCDRDGRFWVGSMRDFAAATTGSLYRIAAKGAGLIVDAVLSPMGIPNAIAWSPDGTKMYLADSLQGDILEYAFDRAAGEIRDGRVFLEKGMVPGKPDGATVDAEGYLWNARYGGGCVVRVAPDGRIDRVIELPTANVTSVAFGGSDLRTLYITTATQRLDPAELERQPFAGYVFHMRPGCTGIPETHFAD
jgi:sugar lactone lactonase YvrE